MAPVAVPVEQKLDELSITKEEKKPDTVDAEDGDNDDDDDDDVEGEEGAANGDAKKKKKKKKSKKKKGGAAAVQSDPPRVGLSKIFKNGYPVGEEVEYKNDTTSRISSSEMREKERLAQEDPSTTYQNIRRAGEVHRQVRAYAQKNMKPGMKLIDIADMIESGTRALVEENGFDSGIGFPTGLNLNEIAAHYSPNPGDKTVLSKGDVMKVDFGVHVQGRIVDSAFTIECEDNKWSKLLEAVKDATNTGVREAGIDVRLCDVGEAIQEVMESYEVEVDGKVYPVKSISNLNGHSIAPYSIHGGVGDKPGKSVPIVKHHGADQDTTRMEEGEYFAIETFGSTGRGRVIEEGACSHYALSPYSSEHKYTGHHQSAKSLLASIKRNFGTLPFCRRYLEHVGEKNYLLALNTLVKERVVMDYPPLVDPQPGAMTAQFEHTILLRPTCKEVVSRGDDY
ncbi:methionine aminopeptidase, type II [Kwoniella sp. CBS 9459]